MNLNHDILLHVLDFLNPKPEIKARDLSARAALARCARTSHALSNPALRLLWSTLYTPLPLWLLLAPDGETSHTGQQRTDEQLLQTVRDLFRTTGKLTRKQWQIVNARLWNDRGRWDRFLYYGSMVREVNFRTGGSDGLDDLQLELVHVVVQHNGGRAVLPSLLTLAWALPVKADGDLIRLLSPSVVRLVFNPDRSDPVGPRGILHSVRNAAPLLEEFMSTGSHFSDIRVVDELVQFQHLRIVHIFSALPHGDVYTLLSELQLTKLRVYISLDTACPAVRPLRTESLRELAVHGAPPDLAAIFPAWSFPALQHAEIALFDQNPDGGADLHTPGLFTAIVAPLSPTALRDLDVSVGVARPSSTARTALPLAQLLRPAFHLRGLCTFRLTFAALVALSADDSVFAELAAAWPSLQALQLEFRAWHANGPVPTPLVLLSLARSCPNLQKLVLPYLDHTVQLETLPSHDVLEAAAHPLRKLFIADDRSKENITPEVAKALSGFVGGLFPRLLPQFRRYLREPGKAWTVVLDRLRKGHKR